MSLTGSLNISPYSLTGINNFDGTINGLVPLSVINIAGQTAFLSWNTSTSTLTLFIPTSDGIVALGLLSSTDWNTFNNKESGLTFTSPLTRVGNTISFDFTQSLTFDGNTQTLNNNTYVAGSFFFTGATSTTTGYILYIDNFTGYVSKGAVPAPAVDILPLNNTFTGINTFGSQTIFQGQVNTRILRVENIDDYVGDIAVIFTNSFVNDYWFFNNLGGFGFQDNVDGLKWLINKDGTSTFYGFMQVDGLQINNSYLSMNNSKIFTNDNGIYVRTVGDENHGIKYNADYNCPRIFGYGAGAEFGRQQSLTYVKCAVIGNSASPMEIYRDFANAPSDKWEFLNDGNFRYLPAGGGGWGLTASYFTHLGSITISNTTTPNYLNFTEFTKISYINSWIATTHGSGAVSNGLDGDKIVIGNLYPANPAYGATIGSHNYALNAWRDLYVNLGGTTIMPTLIVTVSFTPPSDRRLKGEIRYLDSGKSIDFIKRLKPCIYKRVDKRNIPDFKEPEPKLQHGFIADEIEEIAQTEAQKNLVDTFEFNGYKDCRKLAILNLIPEIVQANKEMIYKIERLETENKTLLERLEAIEYKIKRNDTILRY